jgi:exopolysaccharide biosynthesis operon protein EpsL
MLVGAAYAAPASAALISDNIRPYVQVAYLYDDNLLRLDDGQSRDGQRSDQYRQSIAGIQIDQEIGRQVLSLDAHASRVAFDHFDEYDYTGKDARGLLTWQLGNQVSGHAGASYSQTLAPFADFNNTNFVERNLRVQRRAYVDANWLFHPRWQVHGGYTSEQFRYDLSFQRYNNRDDKTAEAGVDYLTPSGSRSGLVARRIKGEYPDGFLFGTLVSDDYTQNEVKLNVYWRYSAITQLQLLVGRAKREHAVYGTRDQSGTNGRLVAYWNPTVKLKFTGAAWREFASVEGSTINSSLNKGASLDVSWEATSKTKLSGQMRKENRDFNTINAAVVTDPHDSTTSAGLTLTYMPIPLAEIDVGLTHSKRNGNFVVGSGNYKSNSVSISAQISF